jgi:hypothetical protein
MWGSVKFLLVKIKFFWNVTRSALLWDITRRRVVIVYRAFLHGLLNSEDGTDTLSWNIGK